MRFSIGSALCLRRRPTPDSLPPRFSCRLLRRVRQPAAQLESEGLDVLAEIPNLRQQAGISFRSQLIAKRELYAAMRFEVPAQFGIESV